MCHVNCCLHEMIDLAADAMLRMAGKRIATSLRSSQ